MDLNSEESLLLTSMVNTNIYADVLKKNKACQIYEYMYLIFFYYFTGKYGELIWNNNWISFLDTMLQMSILRLSGNGLRLPTRIKSITVNPLFHGKNAYTNDQEQSGRVIHLLLVHLPYMY